MHTLVTYLSASGVPAAEIDRFMGKRVPKRAASHAAYDFAPKLIEKNALLTNGAALKRSAVQSRFAPSIFLFSSQNQRATAAARPYRFGFVGATVAAAGMCRNYGQA
jgi:hypothetical protein